MRNARQAPRHRFAKDTPNQYNKIVAAAEKPGGGVIDAKELNSAVKKWWSDQPDSSTDAVSDPNAEIKRTNPITGAWRDFTVDKLGVETDHDDILKVLNRGSGVVQDWSASTSAVC